jgi:hypothetical protein
MTRTVIGLVLGLAAGLLITVVVIFAGSVSSSTHRARRTRSSWWPSSPSRRSPVRGLPFAPAGAES